MQTVVFHRNRVNTYNMRHIFKILLILFLLSCETKNELPYENETDPKILIQGKWEIIAIGNGDDLESYPVTGYKEYYQDSLIRYFDYETSMFSKITAKYIIDDSLIYESEYYPDADATISFECTYEFLEKNQKLRLDRPYMINTTSIYKRIY